MPPKTRHQQISQKAQLQFHKQPRDGTKHQYEALLLQSIIHTFQVPSKATDHNTITFWVTPQFDTTENRLSALQKHHHLDWPKHWHQKSTCKLLHLTFESSQPSSSNQLEKDISKRRHLVSMLSPQCCGETSAPDHQSLHHMCMPLHTQTKGHLRKTMPFPQIRAKTAFHATSFTQELLISQILGSWAYSG